MSSSTRRNMSKAESCVAYRKRLRERALKLFSDIFGPHCQHCTNREANKLQFAHTKPTGLSGASRGFERRYLDVLRSIQRSTCCCVLSVTGSLTGKRQRRRKHEHERQV
jgi:hypothetical protein